MEARTLCDRYDLLVRAGAGAMGVVYRARDRTTGSTVALKVLSAGAHEGPQRFGREARVLAEIRHPAIVSYVDHGVDAAGGEPYIAMEWLDGETLADRLIRGPLRVGESVRLAHRVADALGAVHAREIGRAHV